MEDDRYPYVLSCLSTKEEKSAVKNLGIEDKRVIYVPCNTSDEERLKKIQGIFTKRSHLYGVFTQEEIDIMTMGAHNE